ncbi:MAG TPA: Gfo/Idh/MocA family oxidoreductase [Chloroflexota bacterium]|jgi:predicted dehydrogenase|nr:Gfo/Idh/MocA family oxidoreductase [Chloroflexota bacterium]
MPGEKIRLGIIGCGGIARGRHVTGLTLLKRAGLDTFAVTAVCDTVEANATETAEYLHREHGVRPQRYSDWQQMLSEAPLDAVDICLPHGLHHVVGIAALEAGLHVVMEKPYTVTVKTGKALAEAADRAGKVLATAVPHRRMPGQRAVQWALNEGQLIGQPRLFFANYTYWRQPPPASSSAGQRQVSPAMSWRRDRMMGGGAGVIDSGFHFLDTVRYFFGEPERVYAELRAFSDRSEPLRGEAIVQERETSAVVTITFKNGVVGTWCWSSQLPGRETRNCIIYGSEGSIEDTGYSDRFMVYHQFMNGGELRRMDGTFLSMGELQGRMRRAIGPERMQELFPNGVTDHFAIELWDFLDAVERGRAPEVDGWGGLATTALVEAIYESAYSGKAVEVADIISGAAYYGWQRDIDEYWDQQAIPQIRRVSAQERAE